MLEKLINLLKMPVASTALMSSIAAVAQILIGFVTMPILLGYLGQEGLGLWLISLSITGIVAMVNYGLSGAMITEIARYSTENEKTQVTRQITSGLLVLGVIGLGLIVTLFLCVMLFDWHQILGVSDDISSTDVTYYMSAVALCVAIIIPFSFARFVLLGVLKGHVAYAIEILGLLVALLCLITLAWLDQPLYMLALGFHLPVPVIMFGLGGAWLAKEGYRFWRVTDLDRVMVARLWREGAKLGTGQVWISITYHSDILLIGALVGATASTEYGVIQRLFSIPLLFSATLNTALWPTLSKAHKQNDVVWVRKAFLGALAAIFAGSAVVALGFALSVDALVEFWLRQEFMIPATLVVGMAIWATLTGVTSTAGTLVKALGRTSFLTSLQSVMLVLKLALTFVLVPMIGPAGAIWATICAYVVCLVLPLSIYIPRKIFIS